MSLLSAEARARVVSQLVEGCSIASTCRLTGVSKPTVLALLLRVGAGCERLHNRIVRGVTCHVAQCDEIWSYVQKKQSRVTASDPAEFGDAYTFIGMASASKLIISYRVGKRDEENTTAFIKDLRARLTTIPQLYTDGWQPYIAAVGSSFTGGVDYCQVVKRYNRKARRDDDHRYEPPRDPFITKTPVFGIPDVEHASTSHIERQNWTIRMHIRRFTRLCNGFSRKLANHRAAVALHVAWYNLCRIHESIRCTPAMEAGIERHVWSIPELVEAALAEPETEPPTPQPLKLRTPPTGTPTAPARALPNGRGFLRLVGSAPAAPAPAPEPPPSRPPPAPGPRKMVQLNLFPPDPHH
ncbi:IS1 family transposase [Sorangium sp. So ce381]|uniref:IS1 family transposase n=1 Tax=Sorangium sp. So ce381 TaxID=3133307 RepID=UPI003F5B0B5F